MQIEKQADEIAFTAKETFTTLGLLMLTAALFYGLFNRENALSYSIGYNLYGAERVLEGEVPYRDFHTLYTPAIVYLNAALFHWFGVALYTALAGVFVFKILTTLTLYLCARQLMPRIWSLGAALYSLIWLRPNGPFKAVPMHYGALFLALALLFLLLAIRRPASAATSERASHLAAVDRLNLIFAGLALGLLVLFKHNIGVYALLGSLVVWLCDEQEASISLLSFKKNSRPIFMLLVGFSLPVLPVVFYMYAKHALGAMISTLLFGPGEFLLNRLAEVPSPLVPVVFSLWLGACLAVAFKFAANRAITHTLVTIAVLPTLCFALLAPQRWVDAMIFYAPVLVIFAGILTWRLAKRLGVTGQRQLLFVTVIAAAAFMEAFPRFAREQAVAAMPFVGLLSLYLLYSLKPRIAEVVGTSWVYNLVLVTVPLLLLLMGGRLFFQTYFDRGLHLRSDTELRSERGRGIFFPADKAREIDDTVAFIQQRVPEGGYVFPQSYAGSSYLFLADRNNPSGAQFWGGVGVKEAERLATLAALQQEGVRVVITSRKDLEAEKYTPMREFLEKSFILTKEIGETLVLERMTENR